MSNTKTDLEVINGIDQEQKDLFIDRIVDFHRYNHLIERTKGGFAELFSVYIQSPEFKRLNDDSKTDFLQAQFAIYDIFNLIDKLSGEYGIGKYS